MKKLKVFIINGDKDYRRLFTDAGHIVISELEQADLVCFTGGADVSPHLYGERKHPTTAPYYARDVIEKECFLKCVEEDIPMVGICRGGQFLNVMNGGKMYQHVDNHGRMHQVYDNFTGEVIKVTSTHHQMMRPAENGIIIAEASESTYKEHMDEIHGKDSVVRITDDNVDVEVVYYPHTRCLCFQPHPEFFGYNELAKYFHSLIHRYITSEVAA